MGVQSDTYEIVSAKPLTPIEDVMTTEDFNKLMREGCAAVARVNTTLGDGKLGLVGLLMSEEAYTERSEGGVAFVRPENPGAFPEDASNSVRTREQQVAEHKARIVEFEKVIGAENALRDMIVEAVPEQYLAELQDPYLGLSHKSLLEIMEHLEKATGSYEDWDVMELDDLLKIAWTVDISPALYFAEQDKIKRQLKKAGISVDENLLLRRMKANVEACNEFEVALAEWEKKPEADQTYANFRKFFNLKWIAKFNRNNSNTQSARGALSNSAFQRAKTVSFKDQAQQDLEQEKELLNEVVGLLNKGQDDKLKAFIEAQNKALAEQTKVMERLVANMNSNGGGGGGGGGGGTGNKVNPHPECKTCGRKHNPSVCWADPANTDKAPAWWKAWWAKKNKA